MRGDAGKRKEIVEREIAVADRVQAIRGDFGKAKLAGNGGAVDGEGISGQSAGTHGAGVGARSGVLQARDVARECFRMREKKMREQNRLCVLHVRHAGHGHAEFGFGLAKQRVAESQKAALDFRQRRQSRRDESRWRPVRCGCGRCAVSSREHPVLRPVLFLRSDGRLRRRRRTIRPRLDRTAARAAILSSAASVCFTSLAVKMPMGSRAFAQARSTAIS